MHPDYIELSIDNEDGQKSKIKMLGIVHYKLAIHKAPNDSNWVPADSQFTAPDDIDYNSSGWRISELPTGLMVCENDFAPFYEAINTLLALLPFFETLPTKGTPDYAAWELEHKERVSAIMQAYVDW